MKFDKTTFKIPIVHLLLLAVFFLIVNQIVDAQTEGHSALYSLLYSIGFFIINPVYSYILWIILVFPIVLLVFGILKKQKGIIMGSSISTFISIIIILIANL